MKQIGDYRLDHLLESKGPVTTWLGEQVSVMRPVIVDEWSAANETARNEFLANARAKAAVNHPTVASVFEAMCDDTHCCCARECLPGLSFEERLASGETFEPGVIAALLRRLADAQIHFEEHGIATEPLRLHDLHLDDHGLLRMHNTAKVGTRHAEDSARDIAMLGARLPALVTDHCPGTTRLHTVLAWMRGEQIAQPLNWHQVRTYCEQIEHQLAAPIPTAGPATKHAPRRNSSALPKLAIAILGVAALAAAALLIKPQPKKPAPVATLPLPEPIMIPSGKYATPDAEEETQPQFWLAAYEVTISDYAKFLDALNVLAMDKREHLFDHASQPAEKTHHEPADWQALYAAAKTKSSWQGQPVTLDSPIVNVDWWDAAAYCEWNHGMLPTQEQWFAALMRGKTKPSELPVSTYQAVDANTPDRTPAGLLNMAGAVSEWTRMPSLNPANPLGDRQWVIIGASGQRPANGALNREWTPDRALRRSDLGFRVLYERKP